MGKKNPNQTQPTANGAPPAKALMSSALLEKVDELFACQVGEYIDLPQLVVVGDQSSGKSSVLEGLTNLPFPRDSGLCTRFPTHITFRRSNEEKITVSIIPSKTSVEERQEKLRRWNFKDLTSLDAESFQDIMEEVSTAMEIGTSNRTFVEDVLRLEISGPHEQHFSVIDVPGIFKRTTQGVTTKEDIALVDQMVHEYMKNARSVMLVVVPCNVDIATQEILERAEDLDPEGIRTMGILTKPDLVDHGSENTIIDLLMGRRHQMRLGWHLLRNPGQAELQSSRPRAEIENEFFARVAPWNGLDKGLVGVDKLRDRLQGVLGDHIRREFPKVRSDIAKRLKDAQTAVKKLGPKRQSHAEQFSYAVEIATHFQGIVSDALQAVYTRGDMFDGDESVRLATQTVNRGEVFAKAMMTHGHALRFQADIVKVINGEPPAAPTDAVENRTVNDAEDIHDLTYSKVPVSPPSDKDILEWIDSIYRGSRGFELGTFQSAILSMTLKEQAKNWRDLALGYVSDIIALAHNFIVKALDCAGPNKRTTEGIKSLLLDDLLKQYQKALSHAEFLLDIELSGVPATFNPAFADNLHKLESERLQAGLASCKFDNEEHGTVVRINDLLNNQRQSNTKYTNEKIHDILYAYYDVAMQRFVDAVRMQVVDCMLVTGKTTPLSLFSATFVAGLSAESLDDVAGEEGQARIERARLEKEIGRLQKARKIIS